MTVESAMLREVAWRLTDYKLSTARTTVFIMPTIIEMSSFSFFFILKDIFPFLRTVLKWR